MEKILLEVYSDQANAGVVKMPAQGTPGIAIPGDTFSRFVDTAWDIRDLLYDRKPVEAENTVQELAQELDDLLRAYEAVLAANGLKHP